MSSPTRERILDAALAGVRTGHGVPAALADVARRAGVSRQAIYLHFGGRADLLTAVAQHADARRGLAAGVRRILEAPSGVDAVRELVALQARLNPHVWPLAVALDGVRRRDAAAERAWQDRLANRRRGCAAIVARLAEKGSLRPELDQDTAGDLLWTLTSLRTWEDLVLERKWSPARYRTHVTRVALAALTAGDGGARRPRARRAVKRKG